MVGELLEAIADSLRNCMLSLDKDHEDGLVGNQFSRHVVENTLIVISLVYFDKVLSIILRFLFVGVHSELRLIGRSGFLFPLWHLLAKGGRDQECDKE